LWRQKTLALAAIATLGVCIAAATTIFSIVNAVVLRPLPFPEPDRLAFLYNSYPRAGVAVAGGGAGGVAPRPGRNTRAARTRAAAEPSAAIA